MASTAAPLAYPLPPSEFFQRNETTRLAYARVMPKSTAGGASSAAAAGRAPIVLVIGFTGTKEDFRSLPHALASIGHEVLVYDHRSSGESTLHAMGGREAYSLEMLADDCAALIRHVYPHQRVHLLGISMGGMCAQLVAPRHSNLLRTLILGCTTISVRTPLQPPAVIPLPLPTAPPTNAAERRSIVVRMLGANFTPEWLAANDAHFQSLVDESMRWKRPIQALMQQGMAIGRFDGLATADVLANVPILIIHGTRDGVIPVAQARVLAERLPHAELVLLEGVGHLWWTQAEEESKQALATFLDKHERGEQAAASSSKDEAGANSPLSPASKARL